MDCVDITENRINLSGGEREFPVPIWESVQFQDYVVVVLEEVGKEHQYRKRNVLAINPDATIRWVIDKADPSESGAIKNYTGLTKEQGELWVFNANGFDYQIDRSDGSIIDKEFKR
jgi:hypothetical protein